MFDRRPCGCWWSNVCGHRGHHSCVLPTNWARWRVRSRNSRCGRSGYEPSSFSSSVGGAKSHERLIRISGQAATSWERGRLACTGAAGVPPARAARTIDVAKGTSRRDACGPSAGETPALPGDGRLVPRYVCPTPSTRFVTGQYFTTVLSTSSAQAWMPPFRLRSFLKPAARMSLIACALRTPVRQ